MITTIGRLSNDILKKLSPGACRLLLAMREEPDASVSCYMALTGYSKRWINALLQELKQLGVLQSTETKCESVKSSSKLPSEAHQALVAFGVDAKVAQELAAQYALSTIKENIQYVQAKQGVANRPGYLIKRLREKGKEAVEVPVQTPILEVPVPVQAEIIIAPVPPMPIATTPMSTVSVLAAPSITAEQSITALPTNNTEWQLLAYSVTATCGCPLDVKASQAIQQLYEQGYLAEDVAYFLRTFWPTIWPGNKGEPPTLDALMKHIGHAKHLLNMAQGKSAGDELQRRIELVHEHQSGHIRLKHEDDLLPSCESDPMQSPYGSHPRYKDWALRESEANGREEKAQRAAVKVLNCPQCRRSRQICICTQKAAIPDRIKDRWAAVTGQLQIQLNRATYDMWVRRLTLVGYADGEAIIEAPHRYTVDWIEHCLLQSMTQIFNKLLRSPSDDEVRITLCVTPDDPFTLTDFLP